MDRFHLKFIFFSKGWWKVDFKIQKAYSCVSAASAAGVECVHKVVPKLCGKVSVYQSQLRPCLAVAWLWLGCGLAVVWLAVYGKSIQMMNGGSEEAKTLLIFPRRSAKTKHHENIIAKPVNKVQIF